MRSEVGCCFCWDCGHDSSFLILFSSCACSDCGFDRVNTSVGSCFDCGMECGHCVCCIDLKVCENGNENAISDVHGLLNDR